MNTEISKNGKARLSAYVAAAFMLLLTGLLILEGCKKKEDINPTSSSGNTTAFNMRMTDKPGNYDAVYVEVIGAEVHSDVDGWVALNVTPRIYNLLDLTNGKDTLIANGQIAVGHVSQIRLILGDDNTVVVDSQTYQLSTPSAQQSGLKLQVHAELLQGITYNMLLDFDAEQSIVKAGDDKYILKPVIRVVNKAQDGAINGIVLPLLAQPTVIAVNGTDSFSTFADVLTGGFYIGGLQAGSYKVVIVPKPPYSDTAVLGVNVTLGAVTNIGIVTVK